MALLFSRAVTSSPLRKRQPVADQSCQSLGLSLLSPDSSYECYSVNPVTGSPCCCRRSPRLLSNGYYVLTEDSYVWDDEGNVSLTPSKINVSYKENLVRVFRRRRKARRSLASLLSDMTETCQSWLDERVFGGKRFAPLAESSWVEDSTTTLDTSCSFTYDHSDITAPPEKLAQEPVIQEEICSETCYSQEQFTQSLGGLLDVPPPSTFHSHNCCLPEPQPADCPTMKALFLLIFTVFVFTAIFSGCLLRGLTMAFVTFLLIMTTQFFTKSGPMGKWRKAQTEDITSRNE
ncbi:transmembrane protein 71 [Hypomesus transpacificus]|uniref:transmembrane protein 71 n=1 Tax=Hypomesus transpacificus TaxID=137520 RepID=UPI001F07B3BA|nr:transmembrane protein 71 [Hypomesus transpacificus]XP_046883497.1 transmembrane protein 71 [Hypomesus transpacificus]XP_046883498.1 transmembrane protein 71 [Hypomesus transpacificus]